MNLHAGIPSTIFDRDVARRRDLAAFLKSARARVAPPSTGRRRVPGLRREEVAVAAAISVTWYTWLEQERDVRVSPEVARRLAEVLRLDPAGRRYLLNLARPDLAGAPAQVGDNESLGRLVRGLAPHPAYAVDRVWNLLAWNDPAESLLGAFACDDPVRGNVLARLFLDSDWRDRFADWAKVTRSAVAQFRAATAAFAQEPDAADLIERLMAISPYFRTVWTAAEIALPADWIKEIRGADGVTLWRYAQLRPEGVDRDAAVMVYLRQAA